MVQSLILLCLICSCEKQLEQFVAETEVSICEWGVAARSSFSSSGATMANRKASKTNKKVTKKTKEAAKVKKVSRKEDMANEKRRLRKKVNYQEDSATDPESDPDNEEQPATKTTSRPKEATPVDWRDATAVDY